MADILQAREEALTPQAGTLQPGARIGPNAVLQLEAALREAGGEGLAARVFSAAGQERYLGRPLEDMIDEAVPRALFDALWARLPRPAALGVARRAGQLTGEYILANRIPAPARLLLRLLPAPLAGPVLLKAIRRHAWTFAGSGDCRIALRGGPRLVIASNPLAMPECAWHVAVLETLFRALVSPRARARHDGACRPGHEVCVFRLDFRGRA